MPNEALVSPDPVGIGARPSALLAVTAVFFLSGATGLVFQVAWMRLLSLFFGSDVYAAAIVLSVFMAGLSVGSWLGSRVGDRLGRPLVVYGVLEIATGVAAFFVPVILNGLDETYAYIYQAYFEQRSWIYHSFRIAVASATILVPTILMGSTLPVLVRTFARRQSELGHRVGLFYSINTAGALCGTLATGFLLLPMLGVASTIHLAIAINLAIGVGTAALGWAMGRIPERAAEPGSCAALTSDPPRRVVLLAVALSGLAALALEVVWMRILVQSFSATVYAFSIMVACFLFGIFFGSRRMGAQVDRLEDPYRWLIQLQLWLAVSVAILALLTYAVPKIFGTSVWILTGVFRGGFAVASVLAQMLVASLLITVPTTLLGATFPVAVKLFTPDIGKRAYGTGTVYSANTAGAVLGALVGGFLFLPWLGARNSLVLIAVIFAVTAVMLARAGRQGAVWTDPVSRAGLVIGVVCGIAACAMPSQTIINYNLQQTTTPTVLYSDEGVSHRVDIVKGPRGNTIMMVNGNIEADTTFIQRRHFVLKSHLPLLVHRDPKSIAVVGLGLGITLRASNRFPTLETIRVVELTPQMVDAHRFLKHVTDDVLSSPKIRITIDDGRNFMAKSNATFDVITADPIHPRITGVGYLYTREYYESIRPRLRPGGVVTQWMPMYHISKASFDVAFRTFVSVFPNASFWYVRGHGLFVATVEPFVVPCGSASRRFADFRVGEDFQSIDITSFEQFLGHMLMDAGHIARYLRRSEDTRLNTDDNAYLEYKTPFEFLDRTEAIVAELKDYAGWDAKGLLEHCPDDVVARARQHFEQRVSRLVPELAEPIR